MQNFLKGELFENSMPSFAISPLTNKNFYLFALAITLSNGVSIQWHHSIGSKVPYHPLFSLSIE